MDGDLTGVSKNSSEKKPKPEQLMKDIEKCRKFINNYRESLRARERLQEEYNAYSKQASKAREKLKEEINKQKLNKIYGCNHYDNFSHFFNGKIVTYCEYCSRIKFWGVGEWKSELIQRGCEMENPNPKVLPI